MRPINPSTLIYHRKTDTGYVGGSFGVVYKAIEISTGEIVAIKHVRNPFFKQKVARHSKSTKSSIDRPRV